MFGQVQLTLQPLECAGTACVVSLCMQPLSDLSVDLSSIILVVWCRHCHQRHRFRPTDKFELPELLKFGLSVLYSSILQFLPLSD